MEKKIGKASIERKNNILLRELVKHIPSPMTQIHLWLLHGYKNSKLQMSERPMLCHEKMQKS